MLRVAAPHVEDLLVCHQSRWQGRIALPRHAATRAGAKPAAELNAADVDLCGRVRHVLELDLRFWLGDEAPVAKVLLLVVQQHSVLMQEERCQQVLQPDWHRAREELHRILVNDSAIACDGFSIQDQEADVTAMARAGRRVVDGEDDTTILLVLHQAWGTEVKATRDAPDGNAFLGVQCSPGLHREPLRIGVSVASDVVVGHQEV
mmetsp:Transcript_87107/g.219320  ORF Transcript_87107/g.219320 Transcript_87107/m.219320 type:complete len:205 (-) Transcript_87107:1020-1634(-)